MLPKEERKAYNEAFWSGFKDHMRGQMSSTGRRVNWANYPTQVKNTYLRMICNGHQTAICFDIQFKDPSIQSIVWEQLIELKIVLEQAISIPTHWDSSFQNDEGHVIGRIHWELTGVNFFEKSDWPTIYSFFKKHLIEFDAFYQEFNDILITLVN